MKAEETRKNLIKDLNHQLKVNGGLFATQNTPNIEATNMYERPKMFEPKEKKGDISTTSLSDIVSVNGIGFKENVDKSLKGNSSKEIYSMKDLIASNPENMRTLTINPKEIKAQLALVRKKDWQDILFSDIDWFKPIHFRNFLKF